MIKSSQDLAAIITEAASQQTYYTIHFLVDRELIPDAYRAYAYFRWVDDYLDGDVLGKPERIAFLNRQKALIERGYDGEWPQGMMAEECMLADLIRNNREKNSGLQSYIRNMMRVMAFDVERRGQLITQNELAEYAKLLATAVTDALHYFIGNGFSSPICKERYLAATGAHITHMLRDTLDDNAFGYFNIPREYLEMHRITPDDVESGPYRTWVQSRVQLARTYFEAGKHYLAQVRNPRCRIAGWSYIARFEAVLDVIEQDGYRIRSEYSECKNLKAKVRTSWSAFLQAFNPHQRETIPPNLSA